MTGMTTLGTVDLSSYNSRVLEIEVIESGCKNASRTSHYTVKVPYSRLSQTMHRINSTGGKVVSVKLVSSVLKQLGTTEVTQAETPTPEPAAAEVSKAEVAIAEPAAAEVPEAEVAIAEPAVAEVPEVEVATTQTKTTSAKQTHTSGTKKAPANTRSSKNSNRAKSKRKSKS